MQIPDESSLCWTFLSTYWKVKAGRQSTCKRYVLWSWLWGWSDKHFLEHFFVEYVFLWAILNPFLLEQICDAVVLIMRLDVHFLEHFVVQYFFLWLILNPLQCIVRAEMWCCGPDYEARRAVPSVVTPVSSMEMEWAQMPSHYPDTDKWETPRNKTKNTNVRRMHKCTQYKTLLGLSQGFVRWFVWCLQFFWHCTMGKLSGSMIPLYRSFFFNLDSVLL